MFKNVVMSDFMRQRQHRREMEELSRVMKQKPTDCSEDWLQQQTVEQPSRYTDMVIASRQVC